MNYISRQKQLAALLRRGGFDALLVTHLPNILYLCGFTGSAGALLIQVSHRAHKATFYTDGRYAQQAHAEVNGAKVVVGKKSAFAEGCDGAQKAKLRTLGFEAEHLSYGAYKQLALSVRGKTKLKPATGLVEQLRLIKDADEVSQIRASVLLAASLFQTALSVIKPGVAETQGAGRWGGEGG